MEIRTISQLPGIDASDVAAEDLLEVSHKVAVDSGVAYTSNSLRYGDLSATIKKSAVDQVVDDYELTDDDQKKISLRETRSGLDALSGDVRAGGDRLVFKDSPYVGDSSDLVNALATRGYVGEQVTGKYQTFVSPGSSYTAYLGEGSVSPKEKLLFCKIDGGAQASDEFTAPKSGLLVMWGILADSGGLMASEAYVQLMAYVGGRWVTVDFRPWVIGSKSSMYQYVGFNAPVAAGLRLRVHTGFPVSQINNANVDARVTPDVPKEGSNLTNCFYGYVIS